MILLLLPEERDAAAYAGALKLKREEGAPFYFAPGEEFAVAAVGRDPAAACGIAGYALGVLSGGAYHGGAERRRETALALLATGDLGDGIPLERGVPGRNGASGEPARRSNPETTGALLGVAVRHGDDRFYPDPLLLSGLPLGELVSRYLAKLLRCASRLAPPDLLYPILLSQTDSREPETVTTVVSYLADLLHALPTDDGPVTEEDGRRLDALGEALMLSFAAREELRREAKGRIIREGALPEELAGYEAFSVNSRAEGQRLFSAIVALLREDVDG